jgi:restriction endonuclease S subunit
MSKIESFLKFIEFKDIDNWSVSHILESTFSYNEKYPLVKIGEFLKRNKTIINIEDNKEYKRVTIKINNGGVFLRDIKKGSEIGTKKQYLIKKGQFLLSKIDARNGAFGVVPDEVDNAIITGNFWTFDVDYNKINPYFLSLITTTKEFIKFCANASNGTTNRHYLQEDAFLNVKIPLPSLEKQKKVLENYNAKIELAKAQEQEAKKIEESIE